MVELPYGRAPYLLDLRGRPATVLALPSPPPAQAVRPLLEAALDAPIGLRPVEQLVTPGGRVTVIVSDHTRQEPRGDFLAALRARLPGRRWTLAIATGTHGRCGLDRLDLPPALIADMAIVDHDGHADDELVTLGTTAHGTCVRLHRAVVETELVIATGCIRPHYFAGFGAGVKAVFPGLGSAREIRHNHELKQAPGARAGIVDGNPCREDLEEAVGLLPIPVSLLDGVCGSDGAVFHAVAGHPRLAFRRGVELARPQFEVHAEPADLVIASDALPVTASLYQASKIAAAMAPLVRPGGLLVIVAECPDGVGGLDVVNEKILRIGILPRLAPHARVGLVSGLATEVVRGTLVVPYETLDAALNEVRGSIVVAPRASQLIIS